MAALATARGPTPRVPPPADQPTGVTGIPAGQARGSYGGNASVAGVTSTDGTGLLDVDGAAVLGGAVAPGVDDGAVVELGAPVTDR